MRHFTDRHGDKWAIELDLALVQDIKRELGIDLLNLESISTLAEVRDDGYVLGDVLALICHEQIQRRHGDQVRSIELCYQERMQAAAGKPEQEALAEERDAKIRQVGDAARYFARCFDGEALDRAARALLEELTDFFPRLQRPVIAKALEKADAMTSHLAEQAVALLEDPTTWTHGSLSTSSPPSPGSPTSGSAASPSDGSGTEPDSCSVSGGSTPPP